MTSSLVGSEMCIRDSKSTMQRPSFLGKHVRPMVAPLVLAGDPPSFDTKVANVALDLPHWKA
eukprot:7134810-Prorocentrum_lima.AAC.1